MINSNPETVSTDYDISDKLFFEPLTLEDVLHVVQSEKPLGVIVQFGGQTPLNLARGLAAAGVPILGTQPDAIDRAEDRRLFLEIVNRHRLQQPESATVTSVEEAVAVAGRIGYPVLVRPSYVLGGRSMEIIYDTDTLRSFMTQVLELFPDNQILIDKFLEDAIEVDVDSISDGRQCVICGVMEHIEEAGIHSGDSACVLPPPTLKKGVVERLERQTRAIARELGVVGLMNIQFAIKDSEVYVLEVNPRASRTVPFVSKAIGVPLARLATKVMLGRSLKELGFTRKRTPRHVSVKESVFPFKRFPNINIALGPEMKSTGGSWAWMRPMSWPSPSPSSPRDVTCPPPETCSSACTTSTRSASCPWRGPFPTWGHDPVHPHGGLPERPGRVRADRAQGERGQAQRGRCHHERTDPARHQREHRAGDRRRTPTRSPETPYGTMSPMPPPLRRPRP
jgi:carbamoyl-phosphate synthase large subunit